MVAIALVLSSVLGGVSAGLTYSFGYGVMGGLISFLAVGQIAFALIASFWLPVGTGDEREEYLRQIEQDLLAFREAREAETAGNEHRHELLLRDNRRGAEAAI